MLISTPRSSTHLVMTAWTTWASRGMMSMHKKIFQSNGHIDPSLALILLGQWLKHPAFIGKEPPNSSVRHVMLSTFLCPITKFQWWSILHLTWWLPEDLRPSPSDQLTPFFPNTSPHVFNLWSPKFFTYFLTNLDLTICVISHIGCSFPLTLQPPLVKSSSHHLMLRNS